VENETDRSLKFVEILKFYAQRVTGQWLSRDALGKTPHQRYLLWSDLSRQKIQQYNVAVLGRRTPSGRFFARASGEISRFSVRTVCSSLEALPDGRETLHFAKS
jgi:hypothetical protein